MKEPVFFKNCDAIVEIVAIINNGGLLNDGLPPPADFDLNSNDILNCNEINTCKLVLDGEAVTAVGSAPVFEGARVYQNTATTGISSTPTVLAFDAEAFDTDGLHDNSTNNSRLTVSSNGYWVATCDLEVKNVDNYEFLALRIRKNGTTVIAQTIRLFEPSVSFNTAPAIQITSGPLKFITGDYLEVLALLIPTDDTLTGEDDGTWFSLYKVGT